MSESTSVPEVDLGIRRTVGMRIRYMRNERGLRLTGLAAASGTSKGYLGDLENARRSVSLPALRNIACGLNANVQFFVAGLELVTDAEPIGIGEVRNPTSAELRTLRWPVAPSPELIQAAAYLARLPQELRQSETAACLERWRNMAEFLAPTLPTELRAADVPALQLGDP